ncbi:hypothetical protein [Amycolatopsis sp.]|uniref:hypothetical protein n=1 Tax=Amycolatopsis sp. TaxID=37632 RepID=UPI0039C8789C
MRYPIGSPNRADVDWSTHYGEVWPAVRRALRRYDPGDILAPGQKIGRPACPARNSNMSRTPSGLTAPRWVRKRASRCAQRGERRTRRYRSSARSVRAPK